MTPNLMLVIVKHEMQNGIKQSVSRYDMYVHKSGEVLLRRKGTSDFIRTGEYIK